MTWQGMSEGLKSFMHKIRVRYPWLTAETISDSLPLFSDYFDMDYRVRRTDDRLELYSWGTGGELRFLLRTAKEIERTEGCTAEFADDGVYLVRTSEARACIYWKGEK